MARTALAVAAVLALAGCAPRAPEVTPAFVALVASRDASADAEQLARGRAVYVGRCAGCHALPATLSVRRADWPATMTTMGRKAKLTAAEQRDALRYALATWTAREAQKSGS